MTASTNATADSGPAIAVYSDVICPWCYIGKRRLEAALADGPGRPALEWLPFELNPDMPEEGMERAVYRAEKFGAARAAELDRNLAELAAAEGIPLALERIVRTPNTRKAHQLVAFASRQGCADAVVDALFRAYFVDGRDVGAPDVLAEIAQACGLDPAAARAALNDPELRHIVAGLEVRAARLGIAGVPFFILDGRLAVSGAQPAATWREILRRAATEGGVPARSPATPAA